MKSVSKIIKFIKQKKLNNKIKINKITWVTPKEKRLLKTSWEINIKKNK
jgi:hypothetical protein